MNTTARTICAAMVCWLALSGLSAARLKAESGKQGTCYRCGKSCELVECTVMAPTTVLETRMKPQVVFVQEKRVEKYTVFVLEPQEPETFKKTYWYLKDEIKTQEITEERCQIVMNPVIREHKVQVPVQELHTFPPADGGCATSQKLGEAGSEAGSCQREVTVMREEIQACTTTEPQVVINTTKRTIDYCIKVPESYVVECGTETKYKLVPKPKMEEREVWVCVPKIEHVPVSVEVCRMVPQTVLCCTGCAANCRPRKLAEKGDRFAEKGDRHHNE